MKIPPARRGRFNVTPLANESYARRRFLSQLVLTPTTVFG